MIIYFWQVLGKFWGGFGGCLGVFFWVFSEEFREVLGRFFEGKNLLETYKKTIKNTNKKTYKSLFFIIFPY